MALVYVGDATFVDKDPVDMIAQGPREWSPRSLKGKSIHWYVQFPSLERVEYGLALLKSGPKSKWLDSERVGKTGFSEPIAPFWQFSDALEYVEKGEKGRWAFEETPYVEVTNKDDYAKAFLAFKGVEDASEMTPQERERIMRFELTKESDWKGPGVYDFRDMTRNAKSVEQYEKESMEFWAKDTLDAGYDDSWESSLRELIGRNI